MNAMLFENEINKKAEEGWIVDSSTVIPCYVTVDGKLEPRVLYYALLVK